MIGRQPVGRAVLVAFAVLGTVVLIVAAVYLLDQQLRRDERGARATE